MSESVLTAEPWPKAAASAVVMRDGAVLLVERGKGARAGKWSLPGGHVEPGETAAEAARREVSEETGVDVDIVELIGVHDVILRSAEGLLDAHYLLAVYAAHWQTGEPVAASDSRQARFVAPDELHRYDLTDGAIGFIDRARRILDRTA